MSQRNYTWQVSSPNIDNGPGVISSAYNVDNKSPFTTITGTNTSGYVKVFPDSTSTDFNIKNLEYAVRTDGIITYRVQDGTNDPRLYNSLQQLADGRGNWGATTTDQVKIQMNANLSEIARSKNIAQPLPNPPQATPPTGPADNPNPVTLDQIGLIVKDGIPGTPPKKNYGKLFYPEKTGDMDVVTFTAKTYGTRGFKTDSSFDFDKRKFSTPIGSATLGIQPGISDENYVNWSPSEMSLIEQALSGSGLGFIESGNITGILDKIITGVKQPGAQAALITMLTQEASGSKGLLSRLTGAISNPNMELLFQGPQLRTFNFNFKLSPRSDSESVQVKKIINFFKRNMAVQRSQPQLFLKAPNVFDIQYMYANTAEHLGLNKIKGPCALSNCSVNYTPTGSYMTIMDSGKNQNQHSMVSYELSLTFNELEPIYEDEYGPPGDDVTNIGY